VNVRFLLSSLGLALVLAGCGQQSGGTGPDNRNAEQYAEELHELDERLDEWSEGSVDYRIPLFRMNERNLDMVRTGDGSVSLVGESLTEYEQYTDAYIAVKTAGERAGLPDPATMQLKSISSGSNAVEHMLQYVYENVEDKETYYIYRASLSAGDTIARVDYSFDGNQYESLELGGEAESVIDLGGVAIFPVDAVELDIPAALVQGELELNLLRFGPRFDQAGLLQDAEIMDFAVTSSRDAELHLKLEWLGLEDDDQLQTQQSYTVYAGIEKELSGIVLPMDERISAYNGIVKITAAWNEEEPAVFYYDLIHKVIVTNPTRPAVAIHAAAIGY